MADLKIVDVRKSYGKKEVLKGVSLTAGTGEFLALLGPSGCGKTTLLNTISGIVRQDAGQVLVDGRDISRSPIEKRNIGVVFQNYALFAHMNVFENVAYPLRLKKVPKAELQQRVGQALETVRLDGYAPRRIAQLSGGEQQRVALARAIVYRPDILLLDEPLSALDRKIREQMQIEVRRIQREIGITTVFVTHDQGEALSMADRVLLMHGGQIIEDNTPAEVYLHPKSAFAADFIGASNVLEGRYEHGRVNAGGLALPVGEQAVSDGARVRARLKEENLPGGSERPDPGQTVFGPVHPHHAALRGAHPVRPDPRPGSRTAHRGLRRGPAGHGRVGVRFVTPRPSPRGCPIKHRVRAR